MNNIFATSKPVEFVPTHTDLRNWRFLGMEMEALGTRLDAAREALSRANSDWARWYWNETLNRLMLQWSSMPVMHDGEATMTRIRGGQWTTIGGMTPEKLVAGTSAISCLTSYLGPTWMNHGIGLEMKGSCDAVASRQSLA